VLDFAKKVIYVSRHKVSANWILGRIKIRLCRVFWFTIRLFIMFYYWQVKHEAPNDHASVTSLRHHKQLDEVDFVVSLSLSLGLHLLTYSCRQWTPSNLFRWDVNKILRLR